MLGQRKQHESRLRLLKTTGQEVMRPWSRAVGAEREISGLTECKERRKKKKQANMY